MHVQAYAMVMWVDVVVAPVAVVAHLVARPPSHSARIVACRKLDGHQSVVLGSLAVTRVTLAASSSSRNSRRRARTRRTRTPGCRCEWAIWAVGRQPQGRAAARPASWTRTGKGVQRSSKVLPGKRRRRKSFSSAGPRLPGAGVRLACARCVGPGAGWVALASRRRAQKKKVQLKAERSSHTGSPANCPCAARTR